MFEFTTFGVSGHGSDTGHVDLDEVAEPSEAELAEIELLSAVTDAELLLVDAEAALMSAVDELTARRLAVHVARHESSDGLEEAA